MDLRITSNTDTAEFNIDTVDFNIDTAEFNIDTAEFNTNTVVKTTIKRIPREISLMK